MKFHHKGHDMSHFEIRQILLGHPEVFTNIEIIQISTLSFELRIKNKIKLDKSGNVIGDSEHPPDTFF